jgi:hypothetical protein
MKLRPFNTKRAREKGWALLVVMSLSATALLMVASVMSWANQNAAVVARNNEYFATTYAAEAATEKALGAIVQDDQDYGEGTVFSETSYYTTLFPTASDNSYWTNYQFSGGTVKNSIIVQEVSASTTNVLGPPYSGLICVGATYDIIANAKNVNSLYDISATVGQKVTLGQIPLFQFAIFYEDTMEIDPGAAMNVTGPVHGNTNLFLDPNPGAILTFYGDVSSSGTINLTKNPLDPTSRTAGSNDFVGSYISNVNPLNLPVGTNTSGTATNIDQNVLSILQVPPASENPDGPVGTNRLYNLVDMIITVSNGNTITVTSGVDINGQATVISNSEWGKFVSTNGSFYDGREGQTVDPININVSNLMQWTESPTNSLRTVLSGLRGSSLEYVSSVYVDDQRSFSNATVVTNILSYTTNTATTTTSTFPSAGTYFPPIATNTLSTTGSTFPAAGTYMPQDAITTNTTMTSSSIFPGTGTYITPPAVTTNTTVTTTTSYPAAGTYLGSVTNSGSTHTYAKITGYTYAAVTGYIYTGITGYTYSGITGVTTNYSYVTNWTQFAIPGIVLTNGAVLPPNGLSIATPDPAYIVGNWNVSTNQNTGLSLATSNTLNTLPSAVYADAITVLSPSWNPANNQTSNYKNASTDTVNAAFLTGNVPSNGTYYSGGVENFPRLLENWSGQTLYYNGSMVEMFPSQIANAPWPETGVVYNPPTRNWTFDQNFNNPEDLPPLTPKVIYLIRAQWQSLTPGTLASGF